MTTLGLVSCCSFVCFMHRIYRLIPDGRGLGWECDYSDIEPEKLETREITSYLYGDMRIRICLN